MPSEDSDHTMNVQADLNPVWVLMSKGMFVDSSAHHFVCLHSFIALTCDELKLQLDQHLRYCINVREQNPSSLSVYNGFCNSFT